MALRRPRPLAPQIALVVCTVVAVSLAIKVELHWRFDQATRNAEQLDHARGLAERLAETVRGDGISPDAERLLRVPGSGAQVERLYLVDPKGRVAWSTTPGTVGRALPPLPREEAVEGSWVRRAGTHGAWATTIQDGSRLVAVAPVAGLSRTSRAVVVQWDVSADLAARHERHLRYQLSGLLFSLLLGIALWWALRRIVSGPVEDLARIAARPDLIPEDFAAHVGRLDEIGALARAMAATRADLEVARRDAARRAARLSSAIDATTDGLVLATLRDGRWIVDHVNTRFAELSGRPAFALEGCTVIEGLRSFAERIVESASVEAWIAHALGDPEFEGSRPGALRLAPGGHDGGSPDMDEAALILLDVTTRSVRDEMGRPFGRLWLVRDVTLERNRERRINRQNQELAALDFVGRRVARSLDRAAILGGALDALKEVFEASFATIEDMAAETPTPLAAAVAGDVAGLEAGAVFALSDLELRPAVAHAVPNAVKSLAVVPLRDATGLVAVLVLGRSRAHGFGGDEIALLGRVLHPVETALENARLFARTEEQLVENQTLTEVGRSVGRAEALEDVLEDILRVIHVRLGYRNAAILMPDDAGGTLYVRASVGYHTNLASIRLPVAGDSVTARVLRMGESVNVPDVRVDPGYVAGSDDIRSELALPLRFGDVMLGVLDVESDRLSAFGPDDERLLAAVAGQAAMVLQNARLLVETRARATRFEAVNEIARSVSSTLDPLRLDRAIVTQIARVVPCARYAMLHYDHEARRVTRTVVLDTEGGPEAELQAWDFDEGLDPGALVAHRATWIAGLAEAAAVHRAEARHVAAGLDNLVVVPIALDGVVSASIVAASHQVHGFTAEQIRLLETVSYHVGVALKNARLFARLQQSYTQLDEAQDGLVRSEKLRALGEMASGVAHDFNNVLGAILGRAQLLKHTLGAGEAAELDIIEKAARDGASTVRRLQDFTRVRRDHDLQPVSTRQIVEDCLSLTRGRWRDEAERVGVQYEVTTDLAAARDVAGEPSELREVMTNLILNALDAMPAGGALHLATRDLPAAGEVHVEVTDDGDGMSDEVRARIFDPFFTTKGVRGVGLGLSVVYGIIERHGGRIEVESVRGQGTTMRVVLPVCGPGLAGRSIAGAGGGRPHGPADVLADAGPALHVLVVDDEPGVRSLLAELLRSAGHSAVEVASGREAMVALAGEGHGNGARFDLVLTDLGMPDMSGWDVARAVGEVPDPPPVVLVTGWGIQLDDELLAASGVRDVIAKPFTIEDVLTVARRATERRAA
jgi:signal transduction histidine kinase/ActR/RegA family two-component response regulator